jgi:hypothetical protein
VLCDKSSHIELRIQLRRRRKRTTKEDLKDEKGRFSEEQIIGILKRLRGLEEENRRLKHLVVDLSLDKEALKAIVKKTAGACRMRADVAFVMEQFQMRERRAASSWNLDRSSYQYNPRPGHNAQLREQLVLLARHRPRYGYGRLHALLTRGGQNASVQRVSCLQASGPGPQFLRKAILGRVEYSAQARRY